MRRAIAQLDMGGADECMTRSLRELILMTPHDAKIVYPQVRVKANTNPSIHAKNKKCTLGHS